MSNWTENGRRSPNTLCPVRITSGDGSPLPADLLERTFNRLRVVALLYAGCYFLVYVAGWLTNEGTYYYGSMPKVWGVPLGHFVAAFSILVSLAVAYLSHRRGCVPMLLCDLGLLYEVAGAVGIASHLIWEPIGPDFVPSGISWVCVWILLFAMIVPSTPGKTLAAALATASVTPLMLGIGMLRGSADPSLGAAVQYCLPNYLCAGMAFVGSRILFQLGSDITAARKMGSYELVEKLGEGGMGEVWLARHRLLVRPAAIKLIRPEALGQNGENSQTTLRRFEREVQATAVLRSPHTITVYDFGVTDEGRFYYVMELLEGISLETLVERFGPIPPARAIQILRQVCHSLSDAHQNGLVHRDIKPANIFISCLGQEFDFVKVLDFGLVKSQRPLDRASTQLTLQGITTGTPAYMAPEIVTEEMEVDGRADLYSLGCVGYWLLTGHLVFESSSPMQMVVQHLRTPPEAPSRRSELEIPPELDRIILACLEKKPEQRPESAREVAEALEACVTEAPWKREQAMKWWQTHLPDRLKPSTALLR